MFSRALHLVSRSLASQLPSRTPNRDRGDPDPDANAEIPFNSLDPNSAITRALALPEILERIGCYLDRHSLFNSLVVSRHFYESLLPVLWFSIQLRLAQPFPKILKQLETNLCRIRDLTIDDISTGVGEQDDSDGDGDDDDNEEEDGRETRRAAFSGYLHRLTLIEILARNDLSLLQYLTLDCGFPANSSSTAVHILNSCLGKFSGLKHLDIGLLSNTRDRRYIHQVLDTYPLLESLRIVWSPQSPLLTEDQGPLGQGQQHPTKRMSLRRLHLDGLQWAEQNFFRLMQRCPQLEELKIMGPSRARWDWTVSTIDRFAGFCPRVTRIHIDPGYGSDFEDALLARLLETFSGLRSFHVPRCDLGPETFKALKARIGQLEELNVAFTRKPGVDGRKLIQLMTSAHNLRYLDASGVSLDPWLFYVTQQQEQQQQELEQDAQEDIPEWGRVRPQVAITATSWACRRLEVISIGFATLHVNTRQCQAIYTNLSHLPNLRRIHILPNHFPINFESGLEQLAALRQLTHFDVHGTERVISEDVIKWMGTTWPNLKVLRLYIDGKEKRALVKSWLRHVGRDDVRVETD
ncbi:hypothetical protein EC957_009596 [Mortierella hygrophila]|uniref:F-box domain-containing protein n=1 Tax=Mortierella hygrophila TaxID=979708 RepID=A0A9P6EX21_9FUNG|nr:hypothetical protein EC957_009596 [Mortierella hygrophila]